MATGGTSVPVPIERGEHDEAAKEAPEPELLPLHVPGATYLERVNPSWWQTATQTILG